MPLTYNSAQTFVSASQVRLGGVIGEALAANHTGRLSHFITDEASPAIAIFAPEAVAANEGGDWYGEHAGKWLVAATHAAVRTGDDELFARVRRVADWLLEQQGADGYLGNYPPHRRFTQPQPPKEVTWNGEPSVRTWDIWTHAYLALGLIELWRATDDNRYLNGARGIADLVQRTLAEGEIAITDLGNHFGLSATVMLDPAVDLYLATGEQRYLDLALTILDQMEAEPHNRLFSAALAGVDPSEIATGKAYQILWNCVGIAKLYCATGDDRYLAAMLSVWEAVQARHLTLGGGPWGGVAHRSREVFNSPLVFSPEGYVETCSTMAWIQLNRELLAILGEARFAQEIERTAYNDLIGAQAPNGEDWCYYVFPNGKRVHTTYWRCCKSSGAMGIEELPGVAFATSRVGAIMINLLSPGAADIVLDGVGTVHLNQETDFPLAGEIHISVVPERDAEFTIRVRIPDWAEGAMLRVGEEQFAALPGQYAEMKRAWSAGDCITLSLPIAPKIHNRTQCNVQESFAPDGSPVAQEVMHYDYMALTRGPLVYATGLIDGFRLNETLRSPVVLEEGQSLLLEDPGREPIRFEPYFSIGQRKDNIWRLTWLARAPKDISL